MSTAREGILGRIKSVMPDNNNRQRMVDQRINQPPELIRPQINDSHLVQFREKLELGGGELILAESSQQATSIIESFIDDNNFPAKLKIAPALQQLSWSSHIETSYGRSDGDDLVSVTPAFCAIAETGSVVLLSSPGSPTSLNFLPDVHFVLVYASQLVAHIEDAWTKLRKQPAIPRTVNLITGPSKTADVEQTLQIGAHGPRQLKVILIQQE